MILHLYYYTLQDFINYIFWSDATKLKVVVLTTLEIYLYDGFLITVTKLEPRICGGMNSSQMDDTGWCMHPLHCELLRKINALYAYLRPEATDLFTSLRSTR